MSSLVRRIQVKKFKAGGYVPRALHYELDESKHSSKFHTIVRWPRYYPVGETTVRDVIIRRG